MVLAIPNGSPMSQLFEKIKICRMKLMAWSREAFGNTRHRLEEKQKVLEEMAGMGYGENIEQINTMHSKINELLHQEEVFQRQRSRAIWLPTGDKNTNFFHNRASQRRWKNQIDGLMDENGVWRTEEQHMGRIAEEYFQRIFSTSYSTNVDEVITAMDRVVSEEMNQKLLRPFSREQVRKACFQMHPSKSPRLDGMSPFFFQKYWHIVGGNVTKAVLLVLNSGHALNKMDELHTHLTYPKDEGTANNGRLPPYQPKQCGESYSV